MRLNLGCGPVQPTGWVNVDADWEQWANVAAMHPAGQFVPADPLEGLPYNDGEADGAVAHHVLQMVAWPDLVPWLSEVRRVLQPGGYLRLSVPDLALAWPMMAGAHPAPPISDDHETSPDGKVCLWLSQAGATRSVFTGPWLCELCQRAGFPTAWTSGYQRSAIGAPEWLTELDDQPDRSAESAYVEARA